MTKDQLTKFFGEFFAWTGFVALLFGVIPITILSAGEYMDEYHLDNTFFFFPVSCHHAASKTKFAIEVYQYRKDHFGPSHTPELVMFNLEDCWGNQMGVAWRAAGMYNEEVYIYGTSNWHTVDRIASERLSLPSPFLKIGEGVLSWPIYLDVYGLLSAFPDEMFLDRHGDFSVQNIFDAELWQFGMFALSLLWLPMLAINYVFSRRFRVLPWRE
jgi:hypothetical protein